MKVYEVVQGRREETGISVAELSRRTGIKYERLRTSLEGTRGITGSELLALCRTLGMSMDDFEQAEIAEEVA